MRRALLFLLLFSCPPAVADTPDARALVKAAMDHWRGTSSYSEMTMTIHRPDWQRVMAMRAWTRGDNQSLVRITEPKKDAGSATLLLDGNMWTYNPKINRVIKLPGSMMGQSWMGSDFSNNDVAKSDDIVDQYNHTLVATGQHQGQTTYTIEAVPLEAAAVVWGKELITLRADHLLLEHGFYDQQGQLVKRLQTLELRELGGRLLASRQRVQQADAPDEWTEIHLQSARFDLDLPDWLFTQSNLQNAREP